MERKRGNRGLPGRFDSRVIKSGNPGAHLKRQTTKLYLVRPSGRVERALLPTSSQIRALRLIVEAAVALVSTYEGKRRNCRSTVGGFRV